MVEMKLKGIHKKYDNADFYSVTDLNLDIADRKLGCRPLPRCESPRPAGLHPNHSVARNGHGSPQ